MNNIHVDPKALESIREYTLPKELGFGRVTAPVMIECDYQDGQWGEMLLRPYGPIELDPCAKVFHYGQEIFEGMKAYKTASGSINLFRPDMNAQRLGKSADRLAMPRFPDDMFFEAVNAISALCSPFIPTDFGSSLYLRPVMFATQKELKVNPSNSYKFLLIASPSESYFSGSSVRLMVERDSCRAAPGGTGAAKAGGNYAQSLLAAVKMKQKGFDQIIWLDAVEKKYIEELSGMNFMAVINGELHTPELSDTILPGITRDSILKLAEKNGIKTHEYKLPISFVLEKIKSGECTEAFACGTAAIITPIKSITEQDGTTFEMAQDSGPISAMLRLSLLNIQMGITDGPEGWIHQVPKINIEEKNTHVEGPIFMGKSERVCNRPSC